MAEPEPIVYCIVPHELAGTLHDALRRHFRGNPQIEVIVERRSQERRSSGERRAAGAATAARAGRRPERRLIPGRAGRRAGERRVVQMPIEPPVELPRRARRHADRLSFVRRVEPAPEREEDLQVAGIVTRFQAGDREVFSEIYTLYFDRVYGYLRAVLRGADPAEEATQDVFAKAFCDLPGYEQRGRPFRHWLFTIARNCAIDELRRNGRIEVMDPADLDAHRERAQTEVESLPILDWISDRDLAIFVERLPLPQRQVLLLSFGIGLADPEIATILSRTAVDVRQLRSRALAFLRERLSAVRSAEPEPERRDSIKMKRAGREAPVLRNRRWALYL